MMEDFTSSARDTLKWKTRPVDPELETEFLKRLMIRLGTPADKAQATLTGAAMAAPSGVSAKIGTVMEKNGAQLRMQDVFDSAWRRLGVALDRAGFIVEDRDRTKGTYFVKYAVPAAAKKDEGFFTRWFGSMGKPALQAYQITVQADGNQTIVNVLADKQAALTGDDANKILSALNNELK
jgi:outer membrane protein assembly factor BamC